ncbi:type VI secretion system membrane subunit TssM [Rubrimonas cliftonensis]|uniref:Type VI secretion system protein ImpL n=1 Tax=Rubrimonas cliftonensis TaxID=89524 RepID=A0A1H4BGB0_9RHOB|nr:type VI secretion system membrane subunit TssM [Rubrimonas cliftonensis]SEA47094.1 type VI secretion system protein ImpL [Rubrimonas cliftonensis]
MKTLRAILFSPPFLGFVACALLSAAVWFVGELLAFGSFRPFGLATSRIVTIAVFFLIWALLSGLWWWRRRARNAALINALETPADPSGEALDAERERLETKFRDALAKLRRLRFKSRLGGSRYLYELPWFVFVGPPASGKTTALMNCGLEFPLRKSGEEGIAIDGGAGTRDCDWVFTDEAVFIDTAGRYVTQDSDATVDKGAWNAFLDLLARNRPGEPVNGVIVAIALDELATADPARLSAHAQAVRRGVQEICEKMRAQLPVYVMFTKADLLVGFREFFQGLNREDRAQVWGVTFPLGDEKDARARAEADLAQVEQEFDALTAQLGEMQFPRLQGEADLGVRAQVFGFPTQFSSLKGVVSQFLREAFAPDRYSETMLLRGFYFTSATQHGQPVDRLIAAMSREFGLERRANAMAPGTGGRAYFLQGLLQDVVFPEAGLATKAGRARRRAASAGRWAAIAACVAAPMALAGGWWMVNEHTAAQADALITTFADYEADLATLDVDPVGDSSLEPVLAPLDRLRAARDAFDDEGAAPPLGGIGAGRTDELRAQAELAYGKALNDLLRPRLLYRLERIMDENLDKPAPLYDVLKAYLMLGGRGPLDADYLHGFVMRDAALRYPPNINADLLEAVSAHVTALLEGPLPDRDLNDEAIASARTLAANLSPAQRAFRILMTQDVVTELRPWRITDAGGPAAAQAFVRASGEPLDAPIPGIFTYEGFWSVFAQNADAAVDAELDEGWVLAEDPDAAQPSRADIIRTRQEIREIYDEAFIAQWDDMLNDLRITPFTDAGHASRVLSLLSSRQSPLRRVLQGAGKQTDLAAAPEEGSPLLANAATIGFKKYGSKLGLAGKIAASSGGGAEAPREGAPVSAAFATLRDFIGTAETGSQLETVLLRLNELRQVVDGMVSGRGSLSDLANDATAEQLRFDVSQAPPAVKRIFDEMLEQADATLAEGLYAALNEEWRSTVAPVCRQRLGGRYPFGGGAEAPPGDLVDILGPDGVIDRFFKTRLASYVDTTAANWRLRPGVGAQLQIPQERLAFFQTAAQLREAFFPFGAARPGVRIGVFPIAMDGDVQRARIEIGGQSADFKQGEPGAANMEWPGPQPDNGAQATLGVDTGAVDLTGARLPPTEARVGELGFWGFFKLLDRSEFKLLGGGDRARLGFSAGGRRVVMELRMESTVNPFALRAELREFTCPATL